MIKAILFDLDGTLTDTLTDIANAMNWALTRHGLPPYDRDAYRYLVGNGARVLSQRAVAGHEELLEAVYQDYQARYGANSLVETRPYDGVPALLQGLKERGLRMCVLSNKPDPDTRHVISHFFGDSLFDWVQGQLPGVPLKPDPAAALAIARRMALEPAEFAYLGDTAVDITCARQAGMLPVGALWGFRDAAELAGAGAEVLLRHPTELLNQPFCQRIG